MAELIHTFTSGKMNKDLDERLVPNGEYRDALNLELASSDTSQVGTFQNIKGNLELRNKMYNPKTKVYNQWLNAEYITALDTPVCIGAKADENSNDIYWFIASKTTSLIAYYNDKTKLTRPLLVDTQGVLNFSENYLITGINVIEGILIWTDNQTEPKKIFVEDWTGSTSNFVTHSQIYGRNFIEDDITVIKKYPLQPPVIAAYSNTVIDPATNLPGANIDTQTSASFYQTVGGGIEPLAPGTSLQLFWDSNTLPVYNYGDILLLTNSENDPLDIDAVIRVEVYGLGQGAQNTAFVYVISVGVSLEGATTADITYDVTLEQKPPFFEMKFARFGYRYKYKNNEISAFSPFSNAVFIPGDFDYSPSQGYNLGMTNNIRQLGISDFVPSSVDYPDVVAVDILYKATNNQNVYVVDTFTDEDPEWTDNAFLIETEIITSVVNTNQILRPFDNVPRKAKAQEITANRLLFGNYTQNFNLLNNDGSLFQNNIQANLKSVTVGLPTVQNTNAVNIEGKIVASSVKSIRTYQIGVAYMDDYGRTTPVFTSKAASIIVPKTQAPMSTRLEVELTGNNNNPTLIPYYEQNKQFPYFKYYVKETSREYYNLALDRFYDAEDGNLWLSFPSAERNKVDEETFLILKKEHDSSDPVVEQARYKIIAIENEAPTYLKETKISLGAMTTVFSAQAFPIQGASKLEVDVDDFDAQFGPDTRTQSSLLLRVKSGGASSNYYKIGSFASRTVPNATNKVVVNSAEIFGPDMNFTSQPPYGFNTKNNDLELEIVRVESINKAEFTGRFFVKVFQDDLLRRKIAQASSTAIAAYRRKALGFLYNFQTGTYSTESFWKNSWRNSGNGDGQGARQRLFIDGIQTGCSIPKGQGVYTEGTSQKIDISWSGGYGLCESGADNGIRNSNPDLFNQLNSSSSLFRFINAGNGIGDPIDNRIYEVYNSTGPLTPGTSKLGTTYDCSGCNGAAENSANQMAQWTLTFRELGTANGALQWNPEDYLTKWQANDPNNYVNSYVGIEFIEVDEDDGSFSTANPAIFETEPKEAAELDIYWEVPKVYKTSEYTGQKHLLDFFNCYSFGNGVESDRIRDDFNQPVIENGVKASATLDEPYNEEIRSSGIIFSQIFNSISGTNNLNQFIQAESITKDLNPEYGSIQKFHTRDTDLITLCENKSMKILAKKDALFNADGSTNLTSNAQVLGQTLTFQGEFGIANNPESFVDFGFRMYYTDATRGSVLRLSGDGITDLSDYGMHSFFSDNLPINKKIIGSWDTNKRNYNITLNSLTPYWQQTLGAGKFDRLNKHPLCDQFVNSLPTTTTTVSYKEAINGFTSRKTYIPEAGAYLDNSYYTFKGGRIWEHGVNEKRNTFYNVGPDSVGTTQAYHYSSFTTIFNENPAVVKGYKTLNYSGTKSREFVYRVGASLEEYSLAQIQAQQLIPTSSVRTKGWFAESIITDLQEGTVKEFIDKEGKYFNYIKGISTFFNTNCDTNVDSREFNVQGIGRATTITGPIQTEFQVTNQIDPNCSTIPTPPVLFKASYTAVNTQLNNFNIVQTNVCATGIYFTLESNGLINPSGLTLNTATGAFTYLAPSTTYEGSCGAFVVRAWCGGLSSETASMSIRIPFT